MKKHRKLIVIVSILVLLVALFLPLPFFIESPGSAQPTADSITVNQHHDQRAGKFLFTTVELSSATPLSLIWAACTPFHDIEARQEVMAGDNTKEYLQMQSYFMENASNSAIEAAFKKAHRSYTKEYLGIYVMSFLKNSHFKGHLQVGDTVSEIDGHRFSSSQAFIKYVKAQKVNQLVTVKYQRHGKTHQTKQKLMAMTHPRRPGLGISLVDHVRIRTTPKVAINAGDIGGPSAGLMFSLQIYSQLTKQNLTKGRKIAGTGTINSQGKVGPIGGIDKKVYAANREHAQIFFAPNDRVTKKILKADPHYENNYTIAKKAAARLNTKMKIVPVKSLDDAYNYLKTHQ